MGSSTAPITELDPATRTTIAHVLDGVVEAVASKPERKGASALAQAQGAVQGALDELVGEAAREIIRQAAGVTEGVRLTAEETAGMELGEVLAALPEEQEPSRHELLATLRVTAAQLATPQGVQRKRTKDSRLPAGTVVVTRTKFVAKPDPLESAGRWGNPFVVGATTPTIWPDPWAGVHVRDAEHAVELFAALVDTRPDYQARVRAELRGLDLACWCALDRACHRNVLLAIANSDRTTTEGEQ